MNHQTRILLGNNVIRCTSTFLAMLVGAFLMTCLPAYGESAAENTRGGTTSPDSQTKTVSKDAPAPAAPNVSEKAWHITADKIDYDDKAGVYIAEGHVIISKNENRLTADYVHFNQQTMQATAKGNAVVTDGKDILSGDRIDFNLDTKTGTVHAGHIFIKKRHFFIRGDAIHKIGESTYTATKGCVTRCGGDNPDWKITGRDVKATLKGYGTARHAVFWAKKLPLLYTPYLVFPIKSDRQTGFLEPEFSTSSRNGFRYNQAFFWAINEGQDATFYLDHIRERGIKKGFEYRYLLDDGSKGAWMYDNLVDNQVDDGKGDSSKKWGFQHDNYTRPERERYWLRVKHDQKTLPLGFEGKLDIDWLSDQDYLFEFKRGYSGFYPTSRYFLKAFGRGLDDYDDPVRTNSLSLNRRWSSFNLDVQALWNDNIIAREYKNRNTTLQRLPVISFDGSKQQLFSSPFYFDLETEYVYFYRQDGTAAKNTTGAHRLHVYPKIYYPFQLKNYLTVEPFAGLRGTYWNVVDVENTAVSQTQNHQRAIYDAGTKVFSEIYRVFDVEGDKLDRIKHLIRPEVQYAYTPEKDQEDLPNIEARIDRIEKQNLITYSLTNTLISKTKHLTSSTGKDSESEPAGTAGTQSGLTDGNNAVDDEDIEKDPYSYTYREFFRFVLSQSYDLNVANDTDILDPEPFSHIFGQIQFTPNQYIDFRADTKWDMYEKEYTERNASIRLIHPRGDRIIASYRNTKDSIESVSLYTLFKVTDRLSGYIDFERNLFEDELVRTGYGVRYATPCWAVNFNYIKELENSTFSFVIQLFGLGVVRSSS